MFTVEDKSLKVCKAALVAEFDRRQAVYPQYKDYYTDDKGWRLAVAKFDIKFKSGDVKAGEFVLARTESSFMFEPALEIAHLVENKIAGESVYHCCTTEFSKFLIF